MFAMLSHLLIRCVAPPCGWGGQTNCCHVLGVLCVLWSRQRDFPDKEKTTSTSFSSLVLCSLL